MISFFEIPSNGWMNDRLYMGVLVGIPLKFVVAPLNNCMSNVSISSFRWCPNNTFDRHVFLQSALIFFIRASR